MSADSLQLSKSEIMASEPECKQINLFQKGQDIQLHIKNLKSMDYLSLKLDFMVKKEQERKNNFGFVIAKVTGEGGRGRGLGSGFGILCGIFICCLKEFLFGFFIVAVFFIGFRIIIYFI